MYVRWFETLTNSDVPLVGGKNASLGEMISSLKEEGIQVPGGFATTSDAYWAFLKKANLEGPIQDLLSTFDRSPDSLPDVGKKIRALILNTPFPQEIEEEIKQAYSELSKRYRTKEADVAIRSSATAEDLPDASFAGQQETYLNVKGDVELLDACRKCFASLFTDRAISYRSVKGFDHMKVALSIGVQKMVRSDKGSSGVIFSIDTESGFRDVVVINAAWGLGENVVQGTITPDEYVVFKPLLKQTNCIPIIEKIIGDKALKMIYGKRGEGAVKNVKTPKSQQLQAVLQDEEILTLARWAVKIESHYSKPMDMEWAKDGKTGELFIVQARPETVQSRKNVGTLKKFTLLKTGKRLIDGLAVGDQIACGKARVIKDIAHVTEFNQGDILVTEMTSPDWVPLMKKAGGIVTDHGGRTSHAAIVSRELGVPAIVGTNTATKTLKEGTTLTLSCAEGDHGIVYEGELPFEMTEINLSALPKTKTKIMLNISGPAEAFRWWNLPAQGIGLARMEFIINNIQVHPMALVHPERVQNKRELSLIKKLTAGYDNKEHYFIDTLAYGIGMIAASRFPDPVIVRMSDFKTNEYANLLGGKAFEPQEENPMLGFRGASRYYNEGYREGFALECKALKKVRDTMGLTNVIPMIPFCRTLEEADRVLEVMGSHDLRRGENGLEIYVMCEIPSNVILASDFADRFDGFSIGSNDLTQLTLGVDRDQAELASLFDERNPAVKKMIETLIPIAHSKGRKVGICGQAPSDYPDFAEFLVTLGIDSLSLNPDSVPIVTERLAELEKKL